MTQNLTEMWSLKQLHVPVDSALRQLYSRTKGWWAHMMPIACVLCEMDASKVKLSPSLTCLPAERQLLIQESLPAVLLQGVYLPCDCLHTIPKAHLLHMEHVRKQGNKAASAPISLGC